MPEFYIDGVFLVSQNGCIAGEVLNAQYGSVISWWWREQEGKEGDLKWYEGK